MDMDERFFARTAIENAFSDEARERPSRRPVDNIMAVVESLEICGLPRVSAKEAKRGYPYNVTVVFHWRDCQTSIRGFTQEMYERGEAWLNSLKSREAM